jgi:hypothetical protein
VKTQEKLGRLQGIIENPETKCQCTINLFCTKCKIETALDVVDKVLDKVMIDTNTAE